jgi:5'(3')-deoxyribonucleotidase
MTTFTTEDRIQALRQPTIYIDMDGVVADFDSMARQLLKRNTEDASSNERWPEEEWRRLRDHEHLYRDLPKTAYADRIMDVARAFRDNLGWRLCMLTAIPRNNDMPHCFHDKILWMAERYPEVTVFFGPYSHDKQHHCRPGDILVDDRTSNIEEWQARGGVAVKVSTRDAEPALALLTSLYRHHVELSQGGK